MRVILKTLSKYVKADKGTRYTKISNFTLVELLVTTPVDGETYDVLHVLKVEDAVVKKVLLRVLHEAPFKIEILGKGDLVCEVFSRVVDTAYAEDKNSKIDLMFVLPYIGCLVCQLRAAEIVAFQEAKRITISSVCSGDTKFTFSESLF